MIKLTEIMGAKNFWVLPNSTIIPTDDHLGWFTNNIKSKFFIDDDGFPTTEDGAIADEYDVYNEAFNMGFVRLVKPIHGSALIIDYARNKPPTQKQFKSIKDFAIDNQWQLYDSITKRHFDL